jgi:hypothetical protein
MSGWAGCLAADLHKVVDVHARLFPPSAEEKVVFFFDEIQLVPGWEQFCRRLLDSGTHEGPLLSNLISKTPQPDNRHMGAGASESVSARF